MITATEIRSKAEKKYLSYLKALVEDIPFEGITIPCDKKPSKDLSEYEQELRDIRSLSKEVKGYGYAIRWQKVKSKTLGEQDLPKEIFFESETDFLRFIKKESEVVQFRRDVETIIASYPLLKEWVVKYPQKVIDNSTQWSDILRVLDYFHKNPHPNLYIRELPIQVHTKFIEQNKGIIRELLDILIADQIDGEEKDFERRFGLKYDEPVVRFRVLDSSISMSAFSGVDDICVPIGEFSHLRLPVDTVYIVENKMNMLTLPKRKKSIVIWGHGFGVDVLKDAEWLNEKSLFYWGDLDAQGFQILSEIRTHFPQVKSFLMDRETFDKFNEGDIGTVTNVGKELCLTREERELFEYLKTNNYRLEQEKIPLSYILDKMP